MKNGMREGEDGKRKEDVRNSQLGVTKELSSVASSGKIYV